MFLPWLLLAALAAPGAAQEADTNGAVAPPSTAPVVVDGEELFRLRGVSAFPAETRAAQVADRIRTAARDPEVTRESLRIERIEIGTRLLAGEHEIVTVVEADAALEGVGRAELATVYLDRVGDAIESYREARTSDSLITGAAVALGATLALVLTVWLTFWVWRRIDAFLLRRLRRRIQELEAKSHEIVKSGTVLSALRVILRVVRTLVVLALFYTYLRSALDQFPWTRWVANRLGEWVIGPLTSMGRAALNEIPNLIFLVALFVVVRAVLGLTRVFFEAVERGRVKLEGFDAEWAMPTFKLVRVLLVAFGLVVAYPYIPGSGSDAFKAISLFLGVVFSLGSSSAISNAIAGFLMTYRRAFRVGDVIEIGDTLGEVTDIRLQVTHLRTTKNEEAVVPNSTILSSSVKNYSTLAKSRGLMLHTTVGIGYETPWRQVEAMLLLAAERTPGLRAEPKPFVLQRALGDFAITYELNVPCDDASRMPRLYSELHRNILDVFNEYGVAIMTPAYERDPEEPKLVPPERWHEAPAKAPSADGSNGDA